MGIDRRTGQYMIYSDGELQCSRTIMRMPEAEKFSKDLLSGVSITPWDLHTPKQPEVVFQQRDADGQPLAERLADKLYKSRKVYLPASGFEEYGLTRGCPKCNHFLKFGTWGSAPHSQACRSRPSF